MEDYKIDIQNTRKGCLGGSDAAMLQNICDLGYVPKSAYKRLAVCNGLIENNNITTKVMEYGDFIETQIFEHLAQTDSRWQSNPCLVSKMYSTDEVKIIDHVDFLLQDNEKKILTIVECKASRFTIEYVRKTYEAQLFHHHLLGMEYAKELGNYSVKVMLCLYDTSNDDLDAPWEFDPSKITLRPVRFGRSRLFDMETAVGIVSDFLKDFTFYTEDEEIQSTYLPEKVKEEFDAISNVLAEIKEREQKVDEFKQKLFGFMLDKGIKSIKSDAWSITRVDATQQVSVDYKAIFTNEIEKKRPYVARRLKEEYKKTTPRRGYVTIKTIKNND